MFNNNLERREGEGITLFIDKNSNYGLTHFEPIEDENDYRFKRASLYEKFLEDPNYVHVYVVTDNNGSSIEKHLTRKQTEAFYHYCLKCKAERVNNFHRYCALCEHYYMNEE